MKTRRVCSAFLAIAMVIAFGWSAFASNALRMDQYDGSFLSEENLAPISSKIDVQNTKEDVKIDSIQKDEQGNISEVSGRIGEKEFYYEENSEYRVSAMKTNSGLIDIAVYYFNNPNEVKYSLFDLEKFKGATVDMFSLKDLITANMANLGFTTLQTADIFNEILGLDMQSNANDSQRLMQKLYSAGWPAPYYDFYRAGMSYRGVTGYLYETCEYSVMNPTHWTFWAGTAFTIISTIMGLPINTLLAIITVTVDAYGVYVAYRDTQASVYDVFYYGNKRVSVGNINPYRAGRTVKWKGSIGDIGEKLDEQYDNTDYDFHDNYGLIRTGIDLYLSYGY